MKKTIRLCGNLSLKCSILFCNQLWSLEEADHYEFDFNCLGFSEPFAMAYVANEIKRFRQSKPDLTFSAINHQKHTYPAHMGFFKAFGLPHGKDPGEAQGSSVYIPITVIDTERLRQEADEKYSHVGDIIESKSQRIAMLLTRKDSGDLVDTLTFAIREIIRNVIEHSNSSILEYCAQYWPRSHTVEVAILDTGDGIKSGLSSNPYLSINNERDAIHYALLPGISGKMYKGIKKRKNDAWQNSGFGLYMTSRICRNGGNFFIASNDHGFLLDKDSKNEICCSYKGTALRLRIDTRKIENYSSMLSRFRDEGHEHAKKIKEIGTVEPSMASTMLTRDFQ